MAGEDWTPHREVHEAVILLQLEDYTEKLPRERWIRGTWPEIQHEFRLTLEELTRIVGYHDEIIAWFADVSEKYLVGERSWIISGDMESYVDSYTWTVALAIRP